LRRRWKRGVERRRGRERRWRWRRGTITTYQRDEDKKENAKRGGDRRRK